MTSRSGIHRIVATPIADARDPDAPGLPRLVRCGTLDELAEILSTVGA